MQPLTRTNLAVTVADVVSNTPAFDIHTHLYDAAFGEQLLLWGLDELLVYHYLVAEAFRYTEMPYETFWAMPKTAQAEFVWDALFIRNSPISEACRGVLTTLHHLGLDVKKRDLPALRQWFAQQTTESYITRCMEVAKVRRLCMTNSPFDDLERPVWERGFARDERFPAALRIDPLLVDWPTAAGKLAAWGYDTLPGALEVAAGAIMHHGHVELNEKALAEARRFLDDWTARMKPLYLMCSFPPSFDFPEDSACAQLVEHAVLPHCRDHGLPFAMMIGCNRQVNPQLRLAGDSVQRGNVSAVERLCAQFPDNKFLLTMLSRENQHEMCIAARKFRNLHIFGCWWFTNVPHLINEITRMRLELVGLSLTPQHSDARVLDQIIYKWDHSRAIITGILIEKYEDLVMTGWEPTRAEIERDVNNLLGGAFETFLKR